MKNRLVPILLGVFMILSARAETKTPNAGQQQWFLLHGRTALYTAVQANGSSTSIGFSWNPEYRIDRNWSLVGNIGWVLFENKGTQSDFSIIDYQVLVGYYLPKSRWGFELGGGAQTLLHNGNIDSVASANVYHKFKRKQLGVVSRVFVGTTACFDPRAFTMEFKVGIGLSF